MPYHSEHGAEGGWSACAVEGKATSNLPLRQWLKQSAVAPVIFSGCSGSERMLVVVICRARGREWRLWYLLRGAEHIGT